MSEQPPIQIHLDNVRFSYGVTVPAPVAATPAPASGFRGSLAAAPVPHAGTNGEGCGANDGCNAPGTTSARNSATGADGAVGAERDGAHAEALAGVSLDIRAGERVCILGSNGSGKSTLLQLMNALIAPTAGTVRIMGIDPMEPGGAIAVRRQVAMVFQHPEDQMVTSVAADDVAFGPENLGIEPAEIARRVDAALTAVGMADRAGADPADLSGGQKQRIAIAGALAMEPRILLLDEPCAMLDAAGHRAIADIIDRLSARGITIVHVTHFMDDALRADRVIVMDRGRVAMDGVPADVFADRGAVRRLGLELPFPLQLADRLEGLLADGRDAGAAAGDEVAAGADRGPAGATAVTFDPVAATAASATIAPAACASSPAIDVQRVSFSYASARPSRRRRLFARPRMTGPLALDGVSFSVEAGTCAALVGQTGSGKSTTSELVCALKLPGTGRVVVDGVDTADLSRRRELRRHVGYVSQLPERQLFAETVYDDIAFGPRNLGLAEDEVRARAIEALDAVGLEADDALLERSPFALSGGQQRSVALAGILAMRQPVLVLDEPMAGLDPAGRAHVRRILTDLKHRDTTLLVVTHSMDDVAELADQVIVLDHGKKVADGSPRDVFCVDRPLTPGLPDALAYSRELVRAGVSAPLDPEPLTLDGLAMRLIANGCADAARTHLEEAIAHGTAR